MTTKTETVTRYVLTYVNADGMRTLTGAAQGRNTFATREEAEQRLKATLDPSTNPPSLIHSVWGKNPRFEVRPVQCYAGHFDPIGIYFDTFEGCVFREMLLSDAPELTDEQLDACQIDLVSMEDEGFASELLAYREWISRLGGKQNIASYSATLPTE
jgi:hypothetical protein